jgi:hypothetical protein
LRNRNDAKVIRVRRSSVNANVGRGGNAVRISNVRIRRVAIFTRLTCVSTVWGGLCVRARTCVRAGARALLCLLKLAELSVVVSLISPLTSQIHFFLGLQFNTPLGLSTLLQTVRLRVPPFLFSIL